VERQRCLEVRGKVIGAGGRPLICTPLVGTGRREVLRELETITAGNPDLIEWRADYFSGLADSDAVLDLGADIRRTAGNIPVIFTIRSGGEGGRPVNLSRDGVVGLYGRVCESGHVDVIDFELGNRPEHVGKLRNVSLRSGVRMIMSYHNFGETPDPGFLKAKAAAAESSGADIVKIAVMPKDMGDVLTLLGVTLEESRRRNIPVITMSMGPLGALTRMAGWLFGSPVTFAVGEKSSAPGQIPVADLRLVLDLLVRYGC
jgi:3-dehydroquinate dehydratase-1